MKKIKYLILHSSASNWGCKRVIEEWHKSRGFTSCGYHYIIGNGYPEYKNWAKKLYIESWDGYIEKGRDENKIGAHCEGLNNVSLGICMIGNGDLQDFTEKQYKSLISLCKSLIKKYNIPVSNIIGHREGQKIVSGVATKTCPGKKISMDKIRKMIRNA